MGGNAVKDVRPFNHDEVHPTYKWVEKNLLPVLGLNEEDAIPIGSFGKKPIGETSGDIDIALDATKFIMEDGTVAELGYICEAIDCMIGEIEGYETTVLKGFDTVSVKVPIKGDPKNGYGQVDLMPSTDLKWAKFMYHSPDLSEGESKYKGAARNALMMAILSESTKETTKLFEGQAEEYSSLAIRFPTGVWDIKRSFMGKKGKIVKKGTVLEAEFITKDPQDVIDLAFGPGYKVGAANSFETLWEVMHRKDFIHKHRMNEIISKFKVNLKSMRQDTPVEAQLKYPTILGEALEDVLVPKDKDELSKVALAKLNDPNASQYDLINLNRSGVLKILPKEVVGKKAIQILKDQWMDDGDVNKKFKWLKDYVSKDEWEEFMIPKKWKRLKRNFKNLPENPPSTMKEVNKLEKEARDLKRQSYFLDQIRLLKGSNQNLTAAEALKKRFDNNQIDVVHVIFNTYLNHSRSYHTADYAEKIYDLIAGKIHEIERSDFYIHLADEQWGTEMLDRLKSKGLIEPFKRGNKQLFKLTDDYYPSNDYSTYNALVRFLHKEMNKLNINEGVSDIFVPKTDKNELLKDAKKLVYKFLPTLPNNKTPGIVKDLQHIIYYLLTKGYFYDQTDQKGVAWFKHHSRNEMNGGSIAIDGYKDLDDVKEYVERMEKLNEELLAHIGDPFDPIGLYKNPQRVKGFDSWVKSFLDTEGNMYIEDMPNDWLHKDMANELRILGKLNFHGSFYDSNFVTLIRVGDTNNFAFTEGTTDSMLVRDIMKKAQKKFPQYKFFAKHHEDVRNEI